MSNLISTESLLEDIRGTEVSVRSEGRGFMKGMTAALATAAVATSSIASYDASATEQVTGYDTYSQHSEQESKHQHIPIYDETTFQEIYEDKKSGIYRVPHADNKLIAIAYRGSENNLLEVKESMKEHGLYLTNGSAFEEFAENAQGSFFNSLQIDIQRPTAMSDDIAYTVIGTNDFGVSDPLQEAYLQYFLVMHEFAHNSEYQDHSIYDKFKIQLMKDEEYLQENIKFREINSDTYGAIEVSAAMIKNGMSPEFQNKLFDTLIDYRKRELSLSANEGEFNKLLNNTTEETYFDLDTNYRSIQSLSTIQDLSNSQPQNLAKLNGENRYDFAIAMTETSLSHNFIDDYISEKSSLQITVESELEAREQPDYAEYETIYNVISEMQETSGYNTADILSSLESNKERLLSSGEKGHEAYSILEKELSEPSFINNDPHSITSSVMREVLGDSLKINDVNDQRRIATMDSFSEFRGASAIKFIEMYMDKEDTKENNNTFAYSP